MLNQRVSKKEFFTYIIIVIIGSCLLGYFEIQKSNDPYRHKPVPIETTPLTSAGNAMKSLHQDWQNDVCNAVAERRILIGMTINQVVISWGEPSSVNSTNNASGSHNQWIYRSEYGKDRYVYTTNGIVTSWQE